MASTAETPGRGKVAKKIFAKESRGAVAKAMIVPTPNAMRREEIGPHARRARKATGHMGSEMMQAEASISKAAMLVTNVLLASALSAKTTTDPARRRVAATSARLAKEKVGNNQNLTVPPAIGLFANQRGPRAAYGVMRVEAKSGATASPAAVIAERGAARQNHSAPHDATMAERKAAATRRARSRFLARSARTSHAKRNRSTARRRAQSAVRQEESVMKRCLSNRARPRQPARR